MDKIEKLYEGKAKIVYSTADPELVIQHFKDDATAFDGVKKGQISGKGVANNLISCYLFELLEKNCIATHFIKKLSENEMLVRKVQIIPVELVVRNVAAGSLCKRYGIPEGQIFSESIVECYYKNDAFHDPLMNDEHVVRFNLATADELRHIKTTAVRINTILQRFFDSVSIRLVDFKLEFGRFKESLILADEISPDTCRFWEKGTNRKLDKDRFRFDLGDVEGAYAEMLKRITGEHS
jgi:phosphoribosylaminoimidazole-succinocarboxamide synthase